VFVLGWFATQMSGLSHQFGLPCRMTRPLIVVPSILQEADCGQAFRRSLNLFWIPRRRVPLKEICCSMYEPEKLVRPIYVTIA
jgi:hypothetical protein